MVAGDELKPLTLTDQRGFRLVSTQFPPIDLFADVASAEEFEAIYAVQALSNPRLRNERGDLRLLLQVEIPAGIPGGDYAVAPFTHINPDGSRFSDGSYGVLYIADSRQTAIAETAYHQRSYWRRVAALKFDTLQMRCLSCTFDIDSGADATGLPPTHPIYATQDYAAAQALGARLHQQGMSAIQFTSVRQPGATCWGLFSPRGVKSMLQSGHYAFIWDGQGDISVEQIRSVRQ